MSEKFQPTESSNGFTARTARKIMLALSLGAAGVAATEDVHAACPCTQINPNARKKCEEAHPECNPAPAVTEEEPKETPPPIPTPPPPGGQGQQEEAKEECNVSNCQFTECEPTGEKDDEGNERVVCTVRSKLDGTLVDESHVRCAGIDKLNQEFNLKIDVLKKKIDGQGGPIPDWLAAILAGGAFATGLYNNRQLRNNNRQLRRMEKEKKQVGESPDSTPATPSKQPSTK